MVMKRHPWQMTKAQGDKFKRQVMKILKEREAIWTGDLYGYDVRVITSAGGLLVDTGRLETGTILARFEEPERGNAVTGLSNPYTGKWNFHFGRVDAEAAASHFKRELEKIMVIA